MTTAKAVAAFGFGLKGHHWQRSQRWNTLRHAKRWITLDRFSCRWSRAGAAHAFFL